MAGAGALPGTLAAVREVHRCTGRLPPSARGPLPALILDVLLADAPLNLGEDASRRIRSWAEELQACGGEEDWAAVGGDTAAEAAAGAAGLLALARVVRGYLRPRGPFCEAQAAFLEDLGRGPGAGGDAPPAEGAGLQEALPLIEAAYGDDFTSELDASGREGRVSACVWRGKEGDVEQELRITLIVHKDSMWTATVAGGAADILRADGGATTSDELVLNAIFRAWHQLGRVSLWDAFDIARKTFCSGPAAIVPQAAGGNRDVSLLLDSHSGAWFDWRPEGSAMELAFFTLGEVARRAEAALRGYLGSHGGFELAGEPETVLSPELASRFAEKLAGMRLSSAGHRLRSPGLVFHASPSRDALRSILRRGFLLPGDWIEGTPCYSSESHGSRSGVGVYCSPDLDVADCYCGETSEGLAIVALAAFGVCWEPRDRFDQKMQQSRLQWQRLQWFGSNFHTGEVQGGWRKEGRFWIPTGEDQDPRAERLLAHSPDASGLYDGVFHSRWCKNGSHTEIVLASPDQLLPVLLVPYRRRGVQPRSGRELGSMPEQSLECVALCGVPGSDPSVLALEEDSEWAIFVDWADHQGPGYGLGDGGGADPRAPSVRLCFLLDEAVRGSVFGSLLASLVQGLSGAVQPAEAAAIWFDAACGVDVSRSVPFSAAETLGSALEETRCAPAAIAAGESRADRSLACGGTGLSQAVRFATDGALRKLSRETERYLASMAEPWHRLQSGDDLVSVRCERPARARVVSVERDVFRITGITVGWVLHGGKLRLQRAAKVEAQDAAELRVAWEDGGTTCFAVAEVRGLGRCRARDVAAETQFLFVVVSSFGPAHMTGLAQEALARCVGSCRAQLHGSGARCAWAPVVLGGDAASERLGAYLKAQLSTGTGASSGGGTWWEPVHHCEQPGDLPRVLGVLQEDLLAWSEDGARMGASVSLDQRFVVQGRGFVVDPTEPPRWEVRVRRPRPELESASLMRGSCLIFRGPPPRRLTVDGVDFGVSLVPRKGQAAPARTSAALELGFALEKLAQKLRVAVLGCGEDLLVAGAGAGAAPTRQRLEDWAARLRRWAARLDCLELPPKPAGAIAPAVGASGHREPEPVVLPLLWSLPPAQRASYVRRRRGVTHGVQRTASLVEDALRLQAAGEEEPGAAAWLRRVSQMRFGKGVLRRAGVAEAREPEAESLGRLRSALGSLQAAPSCSLGAAAWLVSTASGLSARDHVTQAGAALDAGLQDLQSAVCTVGMVGVQIRCGRTEASNVEPWLLIVEHVSRSLADTASASCGLDIGQPLKDDEGADAPDVAVLLPLGSECALSWFIDSPVYRAYLAVVFARNPLCTLPSQRCALPVLVWVKSAEQMLVHKMPPAAPGDTGPPGSAAEAVGSAWRVHLAAANTVARLAQEGAWCRLARGLTGTTDPARLLTEANGGPQSVCEALAALCFSPAAGAVWRAAEEAGLRSPPLGRLALALLAEAVSRGCRKLCRSRAPGPVGQGRLSVEQRMLWDALGITDDSVIQPNAEHGGKVGDDSHSDAFDLQRALRRSALFFSPEGKYFAMGRTNCSPQGVVGSLLLHLAARRLGAAGGGGEGAAAAVAGQLWRREVSMRAFIEAVLPGTNPPLVQAALYAQGLRYHSARDRAGGVTPLSQPERILRELAREQRRAAYTRALVEQLASQKAGRRKDARSAQRRAKLLEFGAVHRGLPRLLSPAEVDELNASRPPGDQLELLQTGLLKHHCCYPACPQYLADLRSDKDRQEEAAAAGRGRCRATGRRGLFRHLAPMSWPEAAGEDRYVPLVHAVGSACAQRAEGAEDFARASLAQLRRQLRGRPAASSCEEAWLEELLAGGLLRDIRRAAGAG